MILGSLMRYLFIIYLLVSWSNSYALFSIIDMDIWEQSEEYVKLVPKDINRSPRNKHPVEIDTASLIITLQYLKAKGKNNTSRRNIFSKSQAEQLAKYIHEGLNRANKKLDVAFVINDNVAKGKFITGRTFYADGQLNIIFGDRKGIPGLSLKPASDFLSILVQSGINYNGDRNDWLILDIEKITKNEENSKTTASRNKSPKEIPSKEKNSVANKTSAKELLEARKLRLENARLKKKFLGEEKNNSANKLTLKERLIRLQELYDEKLITSEEHQKKRALILDEL